MYWSWAHAHGLCCLLGNKEKNEAHPNLITIKIISFIFFIQSSPFRWVHKGFSMYAVGLFKLVPLLPNPSLKI
jgi:hypothetical protein